MNYVFLIQILNAVLQTQCVLLEKIYKKDPIMLCTSKIWQKNHEAYTLTVTNVENYNTEAQFGTVLYTENKFTTTTIFGRFNMFIFILKDIEKFDGTLKKLFQSYYFNSRAKYLVAYYGEIKEISQIFNTAWNYFIYNITVVTTVHNDTNIYTFYPYTKTACATYDKYEFLSSCDEDINNVFPVKIPLDLNGCPVKLMPYVIPPYVTNLKAPREDPALAGVEITIVHAISKRMNFSETYVQNPYIHWGYRFKDGSYSLMFKALYDREIDIIFGFTYGNNSYIFDFDPSFCHLTDKSVWFFPTALQRAQWKNLTSIFEGRLWLAIFLMFLINGIAWWFIGRKRETTDEFNDLTLCIMNSLYSLLQGSVMPPKKGNLRIVFFIWLVSCLLIFTAHQCQLISILTTPLYDKQMETLDDLIKSKYEFGFYPTIEDAYIDTSIPINKKILTKYQTCPLTAECLNRTAFKRDYAVVKNIRQVRFLMPRYYTFPNGRPMLFETQEVAFQTRPRYHTVKGFPLLDRFDNLLMLLEANGLISKWDADSRFKVLKIESEPDHEPLSLGHLQGAFFVWIFGMMTSFTVLIIEKICGSLRCCKLKQTNDINVKLY